MTHPVLCNVLSNQMHPTQFPSLYCDMELYQHWKVSSTHTVISYGGFRWKAIHSGFSKFVCDEECVLEC